MNISIIFYIILGIGITLATILSIIGINKMIDKLTYVGYIIFFALLLISLIYAIDSKRKDISTDLNKCSFDSIEKIEIDSFVTKNETLSVELKNGEIYKLSDNLFCNSSNSTYVLLNTKSTKNYFVYAKQKVKYYRTNSLYYNKELWTNILFVNKETYDKIFKVKQVDLENQTYNILNNCNCN